MRVDALSSARCCSEPQRRAAAGWGRSAPRQWLLRVASSSLFCLDALPPCCFCRQEICWSLRENPASSTAGPSPRGRMWGGIIVLSHLAHEEARLGFQRGSDDSEEGAEQIRWLLTSRAHVSVHLSLLHVSIRRGDGSTDRFSSPTYELCHLSRLVSLSEPWFLQP